MIGKHYPVIRFNTISILVTVQQEAEPIEMSIYHTHTYVHLYLYRYKDMDTDIDTDIDVFLNFFFKELTYTMMRAGSVYLNS